MHKNSVALFPVCQQLVSKNSCCHSLHLSQSSTLSLCRDTALVTSNNHTIHGTCSTQVEVHVTKGVSLVSATLEASTPPMTGMAMSMSTTSKGLAILWRPSLTA